MDAADFTPNAPGRLVRTVDDSLAFVPNPIPRAVDLRNTTVRRLSEADDAVGRLAGIVARVNPYLVGSPLLRREAILSSRIEGTITTAGDLAILEASDRPIVPLRSREEDTREVLNYIRAMRHGLQRLPSLPLSLRLLREMHGVLLRGVRGERELPGEFRTTQNFIEQRRASLIGDARFVPPPPTEMQAALADLERYFHEDGPTLPPLLVRMALIHYQFEAIHPFRDGNGRIGRLMMPLILCASGRMSEPTLYLSGFFDENRDQYMDLLLRVSQQGDWAAWIEFFLEGVTHSAIECRTMAQGLVELRDGYLARFRAARSSALLQTLIEEFFKTSILSIRDVATLLDVTPATAKSHLTNLMEAGIVEEITNKKKGQRFIVPEVIYFSERAATARGGAATPEVGR